MQNNTSMARTMNKNDSKLGHVTYQMTQYEPLSNAAKVSPSNLVVRVCQWEKGICWPLFAASLLYNLVIYVIWV